MQLKNYEMQEIITLPLVKDFPLVIGREIAKMAYLCRRSTGAALNHQQVGQGEYYQTLKLRIRKARFSKYLVVEIRLSTINKSVALVKS